MIKASLLSIFSCAAILTCAVMFSSCGPDHPVKDISKKEIAEESAKFVVVNYTQGGKIRGRLSSPLMIRVQDTAIFTEFPNTLHVDFYEGDTIIQSRLDAKYGKYIESRNLVLMKDSVRVISVNGDTLLCNELYWDRARVGNEFFTNVPVVVKTKKEIIYGQNGMEVSQNLKNKSFYGVSNSVFRVPSSQFPQ